MAFYIKKKIKKIFKKQKLNHEDEVIWYILKILRIKKFDVIWCGYGNISFKLIKGVKEKSKTFLVCDTDSVWSRFIEREIPFASKERIAKIMKEASSKKNEEKDLIKIADITTAVSAYDALYYKSIQKNAKVAIFPNSINPDDYILPGAEEYRKIVPNQPSLLLSGTFGHYYSSMDTAGRWFLEKVFPIVTKKLPKTSCYIVGKKSDQFMETNEKKNIFVTGRVDSVLPYFAGCTLSVCPLLFESGTRFKILEAGICKMPVVSTTLGAEGLDVLDNVHLLLADDPGIFAEKIIFLLSNPEERKRLAQNLYDLVNSQYSIKALENYGRRILALKS